MRVIFAGTPEFAARPLAAILDAGHEVALVLTRPDRPAGRGLQPRPSPVKRLALEHLVPVAQPESLRDPAMRELLASLTPDIMVVAAYGLILPQPILDTPRHGCLNIHASLLPRWRGAAPIQRAILAGDAETGVCIMRMEAGLDTGAVLVSEATPIGPDESAGEVHDRLAAIGARLIVGVLAGAERLSETPQTEVGVAYAAKIEKHEAAIDWQRAADEIVRAVRAFNPAPGAYSALDGQVVKIWRARAEEGVHGNPGDVVAASPDGIVVACGRGGISITELQRAGGRRMDAGQFLAGHPLPPSARFAPPGD